MYGVSDARAGAWAPATEVRASLALWSPPAVRFRHISTYRLAVFVHGRERKPDRERERERERETQCVCLCVTAAVRSQTVITAKFYSEGVAAVIRRKGVPDGLLKQGGPLLCINSSFSNRVLPPIILYLSLSWSGFNRGSCWETSWETCKMPASENPWVKHPLEVNKGRGQCWLFRGRE